MNEKRSANEHFRMSDQTSQRFGPNLSEVGPNLSEVWTKSLRGLDQVSQRLDQTSQSFAKVLKIKGIPTDINIRNPHNNCILTLSLGVCINVIAMRFARV